MYPSCGRRRGPGCLFAREFGGAGSGSVTVGGLHHRVSGLPLGIRIRFRWLPGRLESGKCRSILLSRSPDRPAPLQPGFRLESHRGQSGASYMLKMKSWGWLALLLGALLGTVWARRSQDLHCGACRALVDELEWEIAQVDPKKTIQMGSFRINPDGSQSVVEVPYARSEAHLTELLEEVCDRMKEYGEQIDPSTHRKNYVRVVSRNGESSELDLQGIRIDSDISGTLKFACESIVEEYEDELIEFFSREADNVKDKLCSKRTDLCDHALHISHDEL
ncbi:protein canopy homolog 2 isoform X2 [Cavia porcellus]|uniref:protein canopy homolog 2 isoform X2 n=1 Tax=Cavia porcellus TaxID=10141 RepID=UPI000350A966|nr:protein canopy homolog 2 isoform X2 [Cavia porcellus]